MAVLEVRDAGKGIPSAVLAESGESWQRFIGVGLRGMKERLGQLGGKLEISSTGQGATVTASLPAPVAPAIEPKPVPMVP
jgi:signal transduction histidine kinase